MSKSHQKDFLIYIRYSHKKPWRFIACSQRDCSLNMFKDFHAKLLSIYFIYHRLKISSFALFSPVFSSNRPTTQFLFNYQNVPPPFFLKQNFLNSQWRIVYYLHLHIILSRQEPKHQQNRNIIIKFSLHNLYQLLRTMFFLKTMEGKTVL